MKQLPYLLIAAPYDSVANQRHIAAYQAADIDVLHKNCRKILRCHTRPYYFANWPFLPKITRDAL